MKSTAIKILVLAGLVFIAGCTSADDDAPKGAADCGLDQPGMAELSKQDRAIGAEVTRLYVQYAAHCPTQDQLNELRYIWKQNQEFWTEYPSRVDLFFRSNVKEDEHGVMSELVGRSFDVAKDALTKDSDFPMSQDGAPTAVKDMTLCEFSGGNSVYLVVVRDGKVSSIYFFDQI